MAVSSTRDWALAYAALGWRVFPVVPGGKRPLYSGWQRGATTDRALIERYWRREGGPNIGVICGEAFDAFDIEGVHLPALRAWLQAHGYRLPATPIARTGRGGIHILVRARARPAGHRLRVDGVHVGELKAAGGFIVACPSRTAGCYAWHRSPLEVEVADEPAWLSGLVVAPPSREMAVPASPVLAPSRAVALVAGLYRVVSTASEGERNKLLYWAARRVAEHGVDKTAAVEILLAAAARAGLPELEARSTIKSGLQA
jgi:hypothetical protein